jgi:ubiquinone/menaquinone biosynthesis C-methylase UbiE
LPVIDHLKAVLAIYPVRISMTSQIHQEIYHGLDNVSEDRREFIRKAFCMLPKLDRPRILDAGCGRGGPTLELARLSDGDITGIDIDAQALSKFEEKIAEEGLSDRIRVMNCSMSNMDFVEESIDVIWAEATIHIVGFEVGLNSWRRFLVPGGFLVIHEMAWLHPDPPVEIAGHWRRIYPGIRTVPEYLAEIPHFGYHLVGDFSVPEDFWWVNYYHPLEIRLDELRGKYKGDRQALAILENQQREVDLYKKYSRWYGSVYMIMQK